MKVGISIFVQTKPSVLAQFQILIAKRSQVDILTENTNYEWFSLKKIFQNQIKTSTLGKNLRLVMHQQDCFQQGIISSFYWYILLSSKIICFNFYIYGSYYFKRLTIGLHQIVVKSNIKPNSRMKLLVLRMGSTSKWNLSPIQEKMHTCP